MSIEATGNKIIDLHPSSGGGGGGTSNYNELTNRPQINSVTLAGDKTGAQLGLQDKLQEDALRTIVIAGNVISVNGTLYYTKEQVDAKFTGVAKTYIVEALPATPDANTYYLVGNDVDGYTLYYYDDNLRQAVIGSYDLDLTLYAKKEQKIGTRQFQGDITVANLFDDLKDYTGTITNKTIDADNNTIQDLTTTNFKDGFVLTAIPESGATDETIATVKAIKTEIDKKQDTITTTNQEADPTDTDNLSDLLNTTNKRWTFAKIWNWINGKLNLELFSDGTLAASRVLYTDANKKLATSTITPTKLGYLANVTSDIQEQLDEKKVNDIQLNSNSLVDENKVANIIGLTNINNDYYYKWVNGSNIKYTKIRTIGASNVNVYTFTLTDNVLTKITLESVKGTIALHSNGIDLELTWNSTKYILDNDYADSQYYIVGKEKQLLTGQLIESNKDFSKCWENINFIKMNDVVRYAGDNAFVYRTTVSAGLTINGDYSTTTRNLFIQGGMAHLDFTCKGSAVANGANWTYLGTIPAGKRPKYQISIVGMVYNGANNEAAGGYVTTNGDVVLWTNAKTATNNYQARVSCSYQLQ